MAKVFLPDSKVILIDTQDWVELPYPRNLSVDSNGYPLMEVYSQEILRRIRIFKRSLEIPRGVG